MNREKFLFIINPISGGLDKSKFLNKLNQVFQNQQKSFELFETQGTEDDHINAQKAIEKLQPDVVVAVGGDGTCNFVAELIIDKQVLFGIIPLGSANGLARELNISENHELAIKLLLNGIEKPLDALIINDKHLCLHLSDIGLNAKVVKRFEEEKIRGKFGYLRQFIREIIHITPKKYQFELKGNEFKKKANMVVIANASKYGTGAVMNPIGKIDDGKFEICIVKPFPKYAIFSIAYHMFRGTIKTSPYIKIISCKEIIIHNLQKEVLQVDGEVIGYPTTVKVTIKKHAFHIIAPKPSTRTSILG
ncbi:diacylglycerol kinase (ATP) [Catalinimonas alkaloidigena]|uniref:diacylglycerol/lipid kinase family protein n=1 Tax=Catalinimonas alkaloidigena TaxID=1075417 RepID=UPI0024057574|nr:diacylglycerol kinase family protein [Catalinimonas alkaloidigena]MDF9796041.1 diacylglycerol kinase (ATP) [Catalinimonas alkaloidigena]